MRDDYCDGLGDCLPACPVDAIHFVERKAEAYNAEAVAAGKTKKVEPLPCGCPGTAAKAIKHTKSEEAEHDCGFHTKPVSRLSQWPVQIKLVNVRAPYLDGAKLLVAADCTAYAYANFHEDFIKGRITLVGCPKLDSADYAEKLTEIIRNNRTVRSFAQPRTSPPISPS